MEQPYHIGSVVFGNWGITKQSGCCILRVYTVRRGVCNEKSDRILAYSDSMPTYAMLLWQKPRRAVAGAV